GIHAGLPTAQNLHSASRWGKKIKIKIKIKIKSQSEKPADFKVAGFPNHRISHSVLSEEQLLKA
ncbi:hypothetical protein, partial [Pseudomonas sp. YuFO8]|uniref:hypothetical protein n=1 Tax=Pseudomonas sp. YuFO8 TaxID=3095361 RepID=UPI002B25639E